ncbi:MAG: exonuclease SbcCD subunit D C-terminal domain-containing protein [Actinomycetaceae bacterium]|nr:exonuclease SbcCD subunit D C-terminal domain-containing protein [Actinomycetaceae bacterium]
MRVIHTADWHIGRTIKGRDLRSYHEAFFSQLIDIVRSDSIDAVLVAGDIYDRAIPPLESVALLSEVLQELSSYAPVILTPGNHDSPIRLGFAAGMMHKNLHIFSKTEHVGQAIEIPNSQDEVGALVYPIPYLDPDMSRGALATWTDADGNQHLDEGVASPEASAEHASGLVLPRSHESVMAAALRRIGRDLIQRKPWVPVIAMAHAFITGGLASDSERNIQVGGADSIPGDLFSHLGFHDGYTGTPLDYVALGHLHRPQGITVKNGPQIRYSGSPLPFSYSEEKDVKGIQILDFTRVGDLRTEEINLDAGYRLATVTTTLEAIESGKHEDLKDAWTRVILTDAHRPPGTIGRIRTHLPNTLEVSFEDKAAVPTIKLSPVPHVQFSTLEMLTEFYKQITNTKPSAQELAILSDWDEKARQKEVSA